MKRKGMQIKKPRHKAGFFVKCREAKQKEESNPKSKFRLAINLLLKFDLTP
jgi:hypothetical protein